MIDIIVPVYDGYDQTKKCIESIIKYYKPINNRVLIINDCSPDQRVSNLLNKLDIDNFIVLNNEQNMGFIGTVNKGIKFSENNDVILLNSDTVVTENWATKLESAAKSSKNIGTVTALTNNGTIVSVPKFNQDNKLPEGYNIDTFAHLVERVSKRIYPTIPTCVGHAVYIKRELINKIGMLDQESFGKGYCEENDFSARAILAGYKNIVADDTFIFHYGSTSFGKDKDEYISQHKKILYKKHRWYKYYIKKFMLFDKKIKNICKQIDNVINRENS